MRGHGRTLAFVVGVGQAGCAGAPTKSRVPSGHAQAATVEMIGVWYTVVRGDSVAAIAKRHAVPIEDIIELNGLEFPERIEVGQRLYLYGIDELLRRRTARAPAATVVSEPETSARSDYLWPVKKGRISSGFGPRGGRTHKGLDIAAKTGTTVFAARRGKVIYSNNKQRGYGNLVIIQHPGGHVTVYAHNQRNLVDEGKTVRQGAAIAKVGSTGRSSGPHLHFEVRVGGKARNPLDFLPAQ